MPTSHERNSASLLLGPIAETLLGMVLAATPVALWIAWTPDALAWILAASLACAALLVLLNDLLNAEPLSERGTGHTGIGARLPEAFVVEAQNLFPFIHHHAPRGSPRFWRAMRRLSQMMRESERGAMPH